MVPTISMRIKPEVRFVLEMLAEHRGQSITTFIERAILKEAAGDEMIGEIRAAWADYVAKNPK